ncbi:hypothetical protein H2199_002652 [Coniosporium tulheliwenetii]|uniref:Uncharacterized protein n=1 Tax=Coniosporium tulheliwenetii TaxID=3383036 RepID=A0ACC2ZGZ0_9PEZI|nr:hypothetical protein H2199_002652 [Cladosporium sp. JES 115]
MTQILSSSPPSNSPPSTTTNAAPSRPTLLRNPLDRKLNRTIIIAAQTSPAFPSPLPEMSFGRLGYHEGYVAGWWTGKQGGACKTNETDFMPYCRGSCRNDQRDAYHDGYRNGYDVAWLAATQGEPLGSGYAPPTKPDVSLAAEQMEDLAIVAAALLAVATVIWQQL